MFPLILPLLAWGALWALGLMLLAWLLHLRTRNAGWVDAAWALGLGGLAVLYAALGPGDPQRRLLVGVLGGGWGLRLGLHLVHRILTEPHEDGRYQELRAQWGGNLALKFLVFFQAQGLLNLVLAVPFLLAVVDPSPRLSPWLWAGVVLWGLAWMGESLADTQLRRFRLSPMHRGQVCRTGLWGWSRHPNYFFEWLVWVAFALLAVGSPWGWAAWTAPAFMLYFLLRVTGIPATEAQALRTKGEAYRRYQREVSAFLPWFPRRSA